MKRAFEENEVFEVAKALNGDKALGSDDFSLDFFQTCKEVIKEDMQLLLPLFLGEWRLWILRIFVLLDHSQ